MKTVVVLVIALLSSGVVASAQPQPSKEAKIEQLLALTNSTAMVEQILEPLKSMTAQVPGATPQQQEQANAVSSKIMSLTVALLDKLRPQMVKIYSETFSDSEIDGMLAFYRSPTGRAMLEKTPALTGRMMTLMQSQMMELMPEIQRIIGEAPPAR